MAEATFTSLRDTELLHKFPLGGGMPSNNHLADALTVFNDLRFIAQVGKYHTHLSPVIGIDGAWGVQYCETTLQCHATARPYLTFIARG